MPGQIPYVKVNTMGDVVLSMLKYTEVMKSV